MFGPLPSLRGGKAPVGHRSMCIDLQPGRPIMWSLCSGFGSLIRGPIPEVLEVIAFGSSVERPPPRARRVHAPLAAWRLRLLQLLARVGPESQSPHLASGSGHGPTMVCAQPQRSNKLFGTCRLAFSPSDRFQNAGVIMCLMPLLFPPGEFHVTACPACRAAKKVSVRPGVL